MSRNIVIFSDGTGQAGGFRFDEDRSNIYKMYRAMRAGPDSTVDPAKQIAFYDPGLGSQADGGRLFGGFPRWVYNTVSQVTGLGITANIVDCYAALIQLWRPGDRIFLFGFSRGAYTIRCLAGVIAMCGIPTRLSESEPLKRDVRSAHALASDTVKNVYQFTESRRLQKATDRQRFLLETRKSIASRFRQEHDCDDGGQANIFPHFIGVFDTVAALVDVPKLVGLAAAFVLAAAMISGFFSLAAAGIGLSPATSFWVAFTSFVAGGFLLSTIAFLESHVKWDSCAATLGERLKTLHLNELWLQFYDTELNANVCYAKHALSIDENRKDFDRVPWVPPSTEKTNHEGHDEYGNNRFEQIWFAGNHSDIGGSYPENESRLSDIALKWMVECTTFIPDGLVIDDSTLRIYPDPTGMQHDEIKSGFGTLAGRFGLNWPAGLRAPVTQATLHKSVYLRFAGKPVVHYDVEMLYRPHSLREHVDLSKYYEDPSLRCPPDFVDLIKCLARHPTGKPIEAADPNAPAVQY